MPDQLTRTRRRPPHAVSRAAVGARPATLRAVPRAALAALAALTATVPAVLLAAGPARASAGQGGGGPVGPAQISPLGHPHLCWEAWGNGSPVTLESCDSALQGQQWTFTANGVLMNGNGYCLQNGGPAPGGDQLYLSFSGQCAGSASQDWSFSGARNAIENPPAVICAHVRAGGLLPGAAIVGGRCGDAGAWDSWSLGASDLTLSGAHRGAFARIPDPAGPAGGRRGFTAGVRVANAAGAMTAYAASVSVRPPRGLTVTRLLPAGGLTGWACAVATLRCRGNLAGGASGQITIAGTVTGRPAGTIEVRAAVARTNQSAHATLTAAVPVRVYPLAAGLPHPAAAAPGLLAGGGRAAGVGAAALLMAVGIFLAVITRGRRAADRAGPASRPPAR